MRFFKLLEYLIFPRRCELCGDVVEINKSKCDECEKISRADYVSFSNSNSYDCLVAPFYFSSNIRYGIHRFKYRGFVELAPSFANEMHRLIEKEYYNIPFDMVSFVPLSKKKRRKRGYNQAELLAKEIADKMDLQCVNLLVKIRNTKSQQGSSAKERRINLKGAFDIADIDVKGKTVLLVDDVRTTGATLNECSKVLKKNGAEKVCTVVIAVTN